MGDKVKIHVMDSSANRWALTSLLVIFFSKKITIFSFGEKSQKRSISSLLVKFSDGIFIYKKKITTLSFVVPGLEQLQQHQVRAEQGWKSLCFTNKQMCKWSDMVKMLKLKIHTRFWSIIQPQINFAFNFEKFCKCQSSNLKYGFNLQMFCFGEYI